MPADPRGEPGPDLLAAMVRRVAEMRDREAFATLFDHFAPRVKGFMMRKGATPEQAEDLVQETMVTLWSKAQLYVPERGGVAAWVFTIARNLRIDRLRREGSAHFTDIDDYDAPSDEPQAEETVVRNEQEGLVAEALGRIPPEQRELLVMSFVDDVPQSEIARRLGIPLGTVKSRMRLAYGRLRKLLEQDS